MTRSKSSAYFVSVLFILLSISLRVEADSLNNAVIDPLIENFIENALKNADPLTAMKSFGMELPTQNSRAINILESGDSSNSSVGKEVHSGFISIRYRTNGDCSGPIIIENGMALGCLNALGQIMKVTCHHADKDGMINYGTVQYSDDQCTNPITSEFSSGSSFPKCTFDSSSVHSYGHRTQAVSCTEDTDYLNSHAGLLISMHVNDKKCRPKSAAMYSFLRKGTCFLDVQDSIVGSLARRNLKAAANHDIPPVFTYSRLDECAPEGVVTVGRYADPGCTRLLSSTNSNLTSGGQLSPNQCKPMMSVIYASATCKQDNKRDNPHIAPYSGEESPPSLL